MKRTLLNFSISLAVTLILSLLFSALLSLLGSQGVLSASLHTIIIYVISVLLFFFFAFLFSFKQKKRGFLHGLLFAGLYLAIYFIFKDKVHETAPFAIILTRAVSLLFGSIIGVNLTKANPS